MAERNIRSRGGRSSPIAVSTRDGYPKVLAEIAALIVEGRRGATRAVNAAMTTTYWWIGRRIVKAEQGG